MGLGDGAGATEHKQPLPEQGWGAVQGSGEVPCPERKETQGQSLGLCQWGLPRSREMPVLQTSPLAAT